MSRQRTRNGGAKLVALKCTALKCTALIRRRAEMVALNWWRWNGGAEMTCHLIDHRAFLLKRLNAVGVLCTYLNLTAIRKACKHGGPVHLDSGCQLDVLVIHHTWAPVTDLLYLYVFLSPCIENHQIQRYFFLRYLNCSAFSWMPSMHIIKRGWYGS